MLVPTWMGTKLGRRKPTKTCVTEFGHKEICMETPFWCPRGWAPNFADGNQQKHLLPSLGTKACIYSLRNS